MISKVLLVLIASLAVAPVLAEVPPLPSAQPAHLAPAKREACLAAVAAKGSRGAERVDEMQICMAEGRLDCVKRAVAEKVPPADRRAYLKVCMGNAS